METPKKLNTDTVFNHKKQKPRILLCWGYVRHSWIETFERINEHFEFIYLYYISKPKSEIVLVKDKIHYWSEFNSPQKIIKKVKPDKVVFMSNTGINAIALNHVCQQTGIPTYVLQHGLFHDLQFYMEELKLEQKRTKETSQTHSAGFIDITGKFFLLKFFLRSLKATEFYNGLKFLIKFQLDKRRMTEWEAIINNRSEFFFADNYIVYTKYNAQIYKQVEGVPESKMLEVGFPQMDEFFKDIKRGDSDYYLLIDEPFAELPYYGSAGVLSTGQMNDFYTKLNEFSLRKGKKLKVKLHPDSYSGTFFIQHENIEFIRQTSDLPSLILNAIGVFGYTSTLLIPALYHKKCCLFRILNSDFQRTLEEIGLCPVVDFFDFDLAKVDFENYLQKPDAKQKYTNLFLYKADGKSTERIKDLLLNHNG